MRLTLHAGLHKTGSSSIQVFCSHHQQCLQASRCFYPDELNLNGAHHIFASALAEGNLDLLQRYIHGWHAQCEGLGCENIIVSSEDLEYATSDQLFRLRSLTGEAGIQLRGIIYIRPQSDLVTSQYSQQVREGFCIQSFDEYLHEALRDADYLKMESILDTFRAALGDGLEVAFYYDDSFAPINVVRDFARRMNIANVNSYTDPGTYAFNPRLNCAQLEFLRQIVSSLPLLNDLSQYEKSQVLYEFIEGYQWPASMLGSPKLELSAEELTHFFYVFQGENTRISNKYMSSSNALNKWYQYSIKSRASRESCAHVAQRLSFLEYDELACQAKDTIASLIKHRP